MTKKIIPRPDNKKECSDCKNLLPYSSFYKDKSTTIGYVSKCKECRRKRAKESYTPRIRVSDRNLEEESRSKSKVCYGCKELKAYSKYGKSANSVDGLSHKCKVCRRIRAKEIYCPLKTRTKKLKREYGMTLKDFDWLINSQNNKCAICGFKLKPGRHTHIDHCHKCGTVRGLLCSSCNMALGMFLDDPLIIAAALKYVEEHKHDEKN